ncbi:hypothetical protein IFM89_032607 [Coptis chinensis]|uniref:Uncharacterized protein n=1 Tax=Coptis chinensis TaxID=261450 RepID=A0A835IS43_9MAGN|nr:hypothetical protein IFM89_032607 [Coptis chinensis]
MAALFANSVGVLNPLTSLAPQTEKNFPNDEIIEMYLKHKRGTFIVRRNRGGCDFYSNSPLSFFEVVQHEGCDWLFALIGGIGTNYKHSLCNLGGIRRHHKKNTVSYTKLMPYSMVVMNSDGAAKLGIEERYTAEILSIVPTMRPLTTTIFAFREIYWDVQNYSLTGDAAGRQLQIGNDLLKAPSVTNEFGETKVSEEDYD